jgi:hypothetical protein
MLKPLMFWEGDSHSSKMRKSGMKRTLSKGSDSDSSLQGNVTGRYGRGTNGVTVRNATERSIPLSEHESHRLFCGGPRPDG